LSHVLITGAAGSIGAALARAFYRRDSRTRLTLIDVDLATLERESRAFTDSAALKWDLSEPDSLPEQVAALESERGPVDVLVNCAGIMEIRSLVSMDWSLASRLMKIDLESPLRLMSLYAPGMVKRRRGAIVNVTSMAGVTPLRGCAYYGAAKAGLAMASEIARLELAASGVHVVTVYPGPVRSNLERRARAQVPQTIISRMLPTGDAETLAKLVLTAVFEKKPRVVYPPLYDLAARVPQVANRITSAFSPHPTE
jgi:short-subunit dehydrogenase